MSDSPPRKKKALGGRPRAKPHIAGPGRGHDRESIAQENIAAALKSKCDSFNKIAF